MYRSALHPSTSKRRTNGKRPPDWNEEAESRGESIRGEKSSKYWGSSEGVTSTRMKIRLVEESTKTVIEKHKKEFRIKSNASI